MSKIYWEKVEHNWVTGAKDHKFPAFKVLRAKVPGGWLVTIQEIYTQTLRMGDVLNYSDQPGGLTFVPDPFHAWENAN